MGTEYPKCIYLREGGWKTAHSQEEEDKIRKVDEPVIEFDPPTNVKIRASDMRPRKRIGPKQLADVVELKPQIDNGVESCLARYEEKEKLMFTDIKPIGNKLNSPDFAV